MEHTPRNLKSGSSLKPKIRPSNYNHSALSQNLQLAQGTNQQQQAILALQRTVGNARVQRLLEDGILAPASSPSSTTTPALSTVAVSSAATEVVPKGTPGTTTATLTITGLPKHKYKLKVEEVESKGHAHPDPKRPLGTITKKTVTTDKTGTATVIYNSNVVGGKERVNVTDAAGTDTADCEIIVRVPDLQELTTGTGYDLVGQTTPHPVNHFGTATAIAAYQSIAKDFAAVPTTITPIVEAIKTARAAASVLTTPGTPAPKPKKVKALTEKQIADYLYKASQPDIEKLADSQLEQLLTAVGSWGLLGYNDMSLEWGGIFDIKTNWTSPHISHRTGQNMDFRLAGLNDIQRHVVETTMKKYGVDVLHEDKAHWHLTVK